MLNIKILMITHNRTEYTKLSLSLLIKNSPEYARIIVWDNGSTKETVDFLKSLMGCQKIEKIIFAENNSVLNVPTNWFWKNYSDATFLSKVDDDCLVPKGWCEKLVKAHEEIPRAGILACWHFLEEDFIPEKAEKKIFTYGSHQIMRNCWIGGSGYIMKGSLVHELGFLKAKESFTDFCLKAARRGYLNGWYFPIIYQEHMDDPRSEHFMYKSDQEFMAQRPLTAKNFSINSIDEWMNRLKNSAYRLQTCSIDPHDYIGIRSKLRKFKKRYLNKI